MASTLRERGRARLPYERIFVTVAYLHLGLVVVMTCICWLRHSWSGSRAGETGTG